MTDNRSYFYANGKRKTSRATVRLYLDGKGDISVNEKSLRNWANDDEMIFKIMQPIDLLGLRKDIDLKIRTSGGGQKAQAEAIRLGISRALVKKDMETRPQLKSEGLLTRDAREKERKKPGLKRARRAPQWSKR